MRRILNHATFRSLFTAQVVALLGTGLLTVALGLLAFDLAGANAGRVLGIALTIKMAAYVGLSPIISALVGRLDRKAVLIGADLVRAGVACCLPFIGDVWHIYALIFILQAASATFTPTFQAIIPDVLPDEAEYTQALSLSRLAYDLENLASPVLAALLLTILAPSWLFVGTALGFLGSAWIILRVGLPARGAERDRPFLERVTRGTRIYLATPRLRGLLALNACVAAVGSIVLVLSVVVARDVYQGGERDLAVLLGAYGLGSMIAAIALPRLLERIEDRIVMLAAGALLGGAMTVAGFGILGTGWPSWGGLLALWMILGLANSGLMTPSGRVLKRSARSKDRPAIFTAQFALSHACWLFAYPIAGFVGSAVGVAATMAMMGLSGLCALAIAVAVWPKGSSAEIRHTHEDLSPDHPHLKDAQHRDGKWVHTHPVVIDDLHRIWPTNG